MIVAVDYALTDLWKLAILPYIWAFAAMITAPVCVIILLNPSLRNSIGTRLLTANLLSSVLLVTLVNFSTSVGILMHA